VTSVIADRAAVWSAMGCPAAQAAMRDWMARLLMVRGRPRLVSWMRVIASSENRGVAAAAQAVDADAGRVGQVDGPVADRVGAGQGAADGCGLPGAGFAGEHGERPKPR
jgi:hypothetical protein